MFLFPSTIKLIIVVGFFAGFLYLVSSATTSQPSGSTRTAPGPRQAKRAWHPYLPGQGYEFELHVRDVVVSMGYLAQTTGKGADFGVDIIAHRGSETIVIQAKNHAANVGVSAVQEIHTGASMHKASEAWVVSTSEFTKAAQALADKVGVRLFTIGMLHSAAETAQREASRQVYTAGLHTRQSTDSTQRSAFLLHTRRQFQKMNYRAFLISNSSLTYLNISLSSPKRQVVLAACGPSRPITSNLIAAVRSERDRVFPEHEVWIVAAGPYSATIRSEARRKGVLLVSFSQVERRIHAARMKRIK